MSSNRKEIYYELKTPEHWAELSFTASTVKMQSSTAGLCFNAEVLKRVDIVLTYE
jgi:hypothetical protein